MLESQSQAPSSTSLKKETLSQVFSCGFCETFKNNLFTEHFCATASGFSYCIIGTLLNSMWNVEPNEVFKDMWIMVHLLARSYLIVITTKETAKQAAISNGKCSIVINFLNVCFLFLKATLMTFTLCVKYYKANRRNLTFTIHLTKKEKVLTNSFFHNDFFL